MFVSDNYMWKEFQPIKDESNGGIEPGCNKHGGGGRKQFVNGETQEILELCGSKKI